MRVVEGGVGGMLSRVCEARWTSVVYRLLSGEVVHTVHLCFVSFNPFFHLVHHVPLLDLQTKVSPKLPVVVGLFIGPPSLSKHILHLPQLCYSIPPRHNTRRSSAFRRTLPDRFQLFPLLRVEIRLQELRKMCKGYLKEQSKVFPDCSGHLIYLLSF